MADLINNVYPKQGNPLDVKDHPANNIPDVSPYSNMAKQQAAYDSIDFYNALAKMGRKQK